MKILKYAATLPALAVAGVMAMSGGVQAGSISPSFQTFGDLNAATSTSVTFGGSGIPTDPAAIAKFTAQNGDELLLGLLAHKRFANPPLGNDGAGTFTAQAGANNGTPGTTGTQATWNFALLAEVTGTGGSTLSDFGVKLFFDLDPGVGTDEAELGVWDIGASVSADPSLSNTLAQTSQNSTFGFLATNIPGFVSAPDFTTFNPYAAGEYSFALRSTEGEVAIAVNVAPIPLPAAGWLLLTAFGGLGLAARRRRKVA